LEDLLKKVKGKKKKKKENKVAGGGNYRPPQNNTMEIDTYDQGQEDKKLYFTKKN